MIAPVQLLLAAMLLIPCVHVFWLSLHKSSFGQEAGFVGLANYLFILSDPPFWRAAWNTFLVVNVVVYGELLLGLGLALLLAGWAPCRRIVISIVLAPYAITEVSAVVMWRTMLEPDVGMINYALQAIGLGQIEYASDRFHALGVVSLLTIWHHAPFTFLILYAAVLAIPRELVEAARIDGASIWQTFFHVELRVILPAVLVALLFRYITAMRLFAEVWLMTEGGPARLTEVLAIYLYRQAFRYHDFGVGAATGFALLVLSLLIAAPYLLQIRKRLLGDAA
jgi:multiple sugar transport system permease protein